MSTFDNLQSFESLDGDPIGEALLDITGTVILTLNRPALLLAQGVGVVFCDLPEDTYEFKRAHIGARLLSQAALKEDIDLWYDQEYLYSGNPVNPAAVILTRDLNFEDGTVNIQGSAVATGTDKEGETVPLNPGQVRRLTHWFLNRVGSPGDLHIARTAPS
ncbi:DUF3846 domain-containing protein [Glycomyces sp. YM15]|uniref:DUF3846 domain-containing protein n=1 Tax=Glycomyces sp. YM15 TaxID=2800446 RepID=UPI001963CB14|nr:DUF3846 domain-containing protein [Glycomyces sp. YM15]